jgi:hypothetical protein
VSERERPVGVVGGPSAAQVSVSQSCCAVVLCVVCCWCCGVCVSFQLSQEENYGASRQPQRIPRPYNKKGKKVKRSVSIKIYMP